MSDQNGACLGDIIRDALNKPKTNVVDLRPKVNANDPKFVTKDETFLVSEGEIVLCANDINFYAVLAKGNLVYATKHFRDNYSMSLVSSMNIVQYCRSKVYG